jgi:hypothetical protein
MSSRIMSVVVTVLGVAVLTSDAFSQQKSLKEQLIGAWELVSIDSVRADGSRLTTFGDNPNGIAFFDSTGHYIITVMRSDRAKYAANDRTQGKCGRKQDNGARHIYLLRHVYGERAGTHD